MSGDFLDSNVILYAFDEDQRKYEIARRVMEQALTGEAYISFQVVQEVLNLLSRKTEPPAGGRPDDVLRDVLMPLWRVMPSRSLYEQALAVRTGYRYSFYDALIIAAALEAGCTRLLSEDLEHGQRIEGLTVVNPFASS